MEDVRRELRGRMSDMLSYLRMLQFIEQAGGTVSLQARNTVAMPVSRSTVYVMKAGVFLHLYNLIESTVTSGLEYIAEEIKTTNILFRDLNDCWRKAWATSVMKLDEELTLNNRLTVALRLCQAVADGKVVEIKPQFKAGALDDRTIEDLVKRYGIKLEIRSQVKKAVKHEVLDDLGFLGLVRKRRNDLAHGHDSFADIGKNYSTSDLVKWSWATYQYLKEVLSSFEVYVLAKRFRR